MHYNDFMPLKIRKASDYFFIAERNISNADTIDGALGIGALISRRSPLSSTAFEVVGPNAPIIVPFCLKVGLYSNKVITLSGLKNTIIS